MSYEQGVEAAIRWMQGNLEDAPDADRDVLAQERDRWERAVLGDLLATAQAALGDEREQNARLLKTLVASVVPHEALLADAESRRWIAPSIWQAMEDYRDTVRALIAGPAVAHQEPWTCGFCGKAGEPSDGPLLVCISHLGERDAYLVASRQVEP